MTKQTGHKLVVILLLLTVFSIPFYLDRSQIGSLNENAYTVSAVLITSNFSSPQPQNDNTSDKIGSSTGVIGMTFIGAHTSKDSL